VAPDGWVRDIAAQEAGDGGCGAEVDGEAAVVAAGEAGLAFVAGDGGLDCDGVADAQGGDGGVCGDDDAGGFVAEDVVGFDDHCWADAPVAPEVDVGADKGEGYGLAGEMWWA